jgi:hypothetical protein
LCSIVTNPGADSLKGGALFAPGNAVMYGSVTTQAFRHRRSGRLPGLYFWRIVPGSCS